MIKLVECNVIELKAVGTERFSSGDCEPEAFSGMARHILAFPSTFSIGRLSYDDDERWYR